MRVGDLCEQVRGVSYDKRDASPTPLPGYLPVLRANNITDNGLVFDDLVFVPARRVSARQRLKRHDIVVAASSGSIDVVGKAAPALEDFEGGFGAFCKVLRPNTNVHPGYFAHFFKTRRYRQRVSALAAGANINNLRNEHLDDFEIPFPPLAEQRRIAAILDQAEAVRGQRRQALAKVAALTHFLFLDLFGDSAANPKRWPLRRVGELASKFSDGPFGSNLKSSHYTPTGVRVVRLQNIGVGEFLGEDAAFISEGHFADLARHECVPGDVLVGTLGDPNLRACVLPPTILRALNKADCVQIRANQDVATAAYICALLNMPSTAAKAHGLILGQTRSRISMGRLRQLEVPVPPIELQHRFTEGTAAVERLKVAQRASLTKLDALFASLQHRAFRGEL